MKIDIERIKVDEETRIRKDIGDLAKLEESISQVGLINPLLVDENNTLVAGYRRLSACRSLGWKEIDVKVVELGGDELKMLEAEAAENLFRKEFTHDEILAVHQRRLEIEESRRHKGWFERFWLWLKRLFQPKEEKPAATKPQPASAKPEVNAEPERKAVPEKKEEPEQKVEPEQKTEPEEKAAGQPEAQPAEDQATGGEKQEEPQTEPETDPQTAQRVAPHARTRTPEITEKDGVRHIKWR
jgi:ParB family transcriptional regulator, chromosome partitioning protein